MRDRVVIYVNGKRLAVAGDAVFLSLVEFLRESGLVGTKIGCGEGDCGACTVLAGTPENGSLHYRTIVSCIRPVHQLDGTHIVTIEGVNHGGTQSDPAGDGRLPRFAVRVLHAGFRQLPHRTFRMRRSG